MSIRPLCTCIATVLSVIVFGAGCATCPHPTTVSPAVRETLKTVSLSEDVRVPPIIQVPRAGGGVLGVMLQVKEENFFNARIKEKLDINSIVIEKVKAGWLERLKSQPLRSGTKLAQAGKGDAEFVLVVDEFGLTYPAFWSGKQKPRIRLTGMLVSHPPYILIRSKERDNRLEPEDLQKNPILWMATVDTPSKGREAEYPNNMAATYRNDPKFFADGLAIAINDALDALIATLKEDAARAGIRK